MAEKPLMVIVDPPIEKAFKLRRRRESVTAEEVLAWIKNRKDGLGWMATTKGIELALDEICR